MVSKRLTRHHELEALIGGVGHVQHQFLGHLHGCHGGNDQPTVGGSAVADGLEVFIEAKERVAVSTDQSRRSVRVPDRDLGCLLTLELIVRSWDMTLVAVPIEVEDPRDVATAARAGPTGQVGWRGLGGISHRCVGRTC